MNATTNQATSIKLVLLGESAVGKSSIVLRFVSNDFAENKEPTIGAAFLTQRVTLPDDTIIKFEIWDTAGQERFASLAPMYYRNAQAAVVVYDLTSPQSFLKARHWVKLLREQSGNNIIIALVANKLDLCEEQAQPETEQEETEPRGNVRKVAKEEGQKLADDEGLMFFETSAKTGEGINNVFLSIAEKIPLKKKGNEQESATFNGNGQSENSTSSNGRIDLNARNGSSEACGC
ncbi:probable Vacuolar protein sorting-associated protein 21 [Saccharomycodes ludwigii]|uniref:Probable Vacuolar protein sorting-associated protein 21 n=1 Tax=Saccharomycodes ludwigii TaxID=36035 RepID=A0A376B2F0_9ASCO|nr:hypothetical protein SCDLUD_002928 [Saccharomycodes ludwigii]KAH3901435.1 hypothetical protein SCDLUD_002928 [Saccharomycodes ludwigii]SSD58664.1 probable Vacuolar protein sorting-associated protein 21 [Saccharomycodes ludwigii]